jgi:hypothetical protein
MHCTGEEQALRGAQLASDYQDLHTREKNGKEFSLSIPLDNCSLALSTGCTQSFSQQSFDIVSLGWFH